jgi:hypothetical protein
MNNTNKMLMIAAITSLLVMGTSLVQMKSFAGGDEHKKWKDSKNEVSKKGASQKMDQDNFCFRDSDCKQANQGQQIIGENNEITGFNDQRDNLKVSELENITGED